MPSGRRKINPKLYKIHLNIYVERFRVDALGGKNSAQDYCVYMIEQSVDMIDKFGSVDKFQEALAKALIEIKRLP